MIGAVIYYGKNTLVAELPMGTMDLQMKLNSIGVGEPADRIPLKDDEERQLQVKLYASSPEEAHLLSLLTPERSLADANTCADLLWQAEQRALPRLKCGLLADSYQSMNLLESKGILTPMGKPTWTVTTIRSILSNEKYKGDALLQKTYVVDCISHKSKKNDDRPQYYVENNHPAIISRETFDRVQEELARRNSKRKVKQVGTKTETGKYSSKFALTELLVCGCCGSPYRRCTWSKNGKKRIVWRCISRLDYGKKYCSESPTLDEAVLQQAIVLGLCRIAADPSAVNAVEALKQHIGIYFSGGDSTAMDELRIKELVANITAEAAKGGYSKEMAAMVQELNSLKQRVAHKKAESKMTDKVKAQLEEATRAIAKLRPEHIAYSDDIVRQVIDCVRVLSAEEIEISFKGGAKRKIPLAQQ